MNIKKILLAALLVLATLSASASDKTWLKGKILNASESERQRFYVSEGTGGTHERLISDVVLDAGDRLYFLVHAANYRWSKVPLVTENAPVDYYMEGNGHIVLRDDRGKEVKFRIAKSRMKDNPSQ